MSLRSIFDRFDYHKQGFFGCEELQRVSTEVGYSISLTEIDQLIEYADLDRDGGITYE